MNKKEAALVKAKKIQCALGIFFLIPAILGVIAFVFNLLGSNGHFAEMHDLSYHWTCDFHYDQGGGGMSAAPIYLGMMALAGAYLIKDSLVYFFYGQESTDSHNQK